MKVLMIRANQGYPDPRVEKELYSLSKEHEVELLGWDRTKKNKNIENREVIINDKKFIYHLICLNAPQGGGFKRTLIPMIKFWIGVVNYLRKYQYKYDAIHFCDFDTAALAFSFVNKKKLKVVYDIFDYYADSHTAPMLINKLIRKRENYIIEKSNAVILCSEKRKEQIKPAKNSKIVIIHNSPSESIKLKQIKLQGNAKHGRKRLVYVGMLSNGRYLHRIANVVKNNPEFEWHVAGFGELEDYFEKLANNCENIFFYGKLQYNKALFLENECDIMTAIYDPSVPNHKYAAPNKFYEALMLGKPVIMMENTGMDKIMSENKLGYVIKNGYKFEEEFRVALDKVKDMDSRKSKKIYSEKYSWRIMEKRLLGLYKFLSN